MYFQEFVDELHGKESEMANAFKIADGFRDEAQVCRIFITLVSKWAMYKVCPSVIMSVKLQLSFSELIHI